tara:strand:+ start:2115 stop:2261 length:147 start_codon:yes stop_codon:yes gene_type:complete
MFHLLHAVDDETTMSACYFVQAFSMFLIYEPLIKNTYRSFFHALFVWA